jgi:hypothetical protein
VWVWDERFSDEFNGTELDASKWHDHHPRWEGRPPAKFMPSSVAVTNGFLRLRNGVLPEPDGEFTIAGGAVVSKSVEAFHGYYETRMKASRIPMSSTFWMSNRGRRFGTAWVSLELDINETIGAPRKNKHWNQFMHSNTHVFIRREGEKEDFATPKKAQLDTPSGEAFHIYAAWWVDATTVKIYLNNEYQFTLHPSTEHSETPFDQPMHLNLVTETYDWEPPPTMEELKDDRINATYYDWVRAYRLVREEDADPDRVVAPHKADP